MKLETIGEMPGPTSAAELDITKETEPAVREGLQIESIEYVDGKDKESEDLDFSFNIIKIEDAFGVAVKDGSSSIQFVVRNDGELNGEVRVNGEKQTEAVSQSLFNDYFNDAVKQRIDEIKSQK